MGSICQPPATTVATTEKEKMKGMDTFYFTYPEKAPKSGKGYRGNMKNSIVSYSEAKGIIVLSVDLDMVKWHSI